MSTRGPLSLQPAGKEIKNDNELTDPCLQPVLRILTYSTLEPVPSVDVQYDLRAVPKPPKSLRRNYSGKDDPVRQHLMRDEEFRRLTVQATIDIMTGMGQALSNQKDLESQEPCEWPIHRWCNLPS